VLSLVDTVYVIMLVQNTDFLDKEIRYLCRISEKTVEQVLLIIQEV